MFSLSSSLTTVHSSGTSTPGVLFDWTNAGQLVSNGIPVPSRADHFGLEITGAFVPLETGIYSFEVDGDDAVDVSIDGTVVTSYYGGHGFGGGSIGAVSLVAGRSYVLRARQQDFSHGEGLSVRWKRPSQATYSVQPAEIPSYHTGSCAAVACPANSAGINVAAGCTCNAGYSGNIIASTTSPFYTGSCYVACPANSAGISVPLGCTCNAGFSGTIRASTLWPYYTGSCTPVACPANSVGVNLPTGCTCKSGYSGILTASTVPGLLQYIVYSTHGGNGIVAQYAAFVNSAADFNNMFNPSNSLTTIYSFGTSTPGVLFDWTNAGQLVSNGIPVPSRADHFGLEITGAFVPLETGIYSFGVDGDDAVDVSIDGTVVASYYGMHGFGGYRFGAVSLVAGRSYVLRARQQDFSHGEGLSVRWKRPSQATYSVQPAEILSYFTGSCAMACPANSAGINVGAGCTCNAGYSGTIYASFSNPFYTGSCAAVACPANSAGTNLGAGCTCNAGYSGTITASTASSSTPGLLNYTVYSTHGGNGIVAQYAAFVNSAADFNNMFNPSNSLTTIYSFGRSTPGVLFDWMNAGQLVSNGIPVPSRADHFGLEITGAFVPLETGIYSFGVDGDDAVDVSIDGTVVASYYGMHGFGGYRFGAVSLVAGRSYVLRARQQDFSYGEGLSVRWKRPSQATYSVQPAEIPSYHTGSCAAVACPANSAGINVAAGCTCNAGYSGNITASTTSPFYTGSCYVACPANSAGISVPLGCTCNAGFSGTIRTSTLWPYYTGSCTPVACPANSVGVNLPTGCTCKSGYSGTIAASIASPFYTGSCTAVACPANSAGTNVGTGCTCNAGYSGTIAASNASPFYTGSCTAVACPSNSAGTNVLAGCTCNAGYSGTITASSTSPFYTGSCAAVACPANSAGTNVGAGCTCKAGYSGFITATPTSPFFTGSCAAVACPALSSGTNVPTGCTCDAGYSGSITASTTSPFYTGSCAVPCPANSAGANVVSGCTCNAGYSGTITSSTTSPFFTGSCIPVACPANSFDVCTAAGAAAGFDSPGFDFSRPFVARIDECISMCQTFSSSCAGIVFNPCGQSNICQLKSARGQITSNPCRCSYWLDRNQAMPSSSTLPVANVPTGCICKAGYSGTITAVTVSPFYIGSCAAVACPANSAGTNVPAGCTCNAGYNGVITATMNSPFYTGSCTAVACPSNSAGTNVPAGCTCNAGYSGTITASTSNPFFTGSCAAVACPANSAGINVAAGCKCNAGYSGNITASTSNPFFTGSCAAVACPPYSAGISVPLGCTCNAGLSGTIRTSTLWPYYTDSCTPVACPANSVGVSLFAGCTCKSGYSGTIAASTNSPYYTGSCTAVACPANSFGTNVVFGCTCNAGHSGSITASTTSPFYTGSCTPVACPANSFDVCRATGAAAGFDSSGLDIPTATTNTVIATIGACIALCETTPLCVGIVFNPCDKTVAGNRTCWLKSSRGQYSTSNPCRCSYFLSDSRANLVSSWDYPVANVPTGCTCKAGYGGVITASTASPFYTGSCTAVPCPANSVGINVPTGCTCGAGYSGAIVASTNSPYYTGSCTAVACPANSFGTNVGTGCTCNAGHSGSITASTTSPFYTGSCTPVACPANSFDVCRATGAAAGFDSSGLDITNTVVANIGACIALCETTPLCVGIVFNPCVKTVAGNTCWLKSSRGQYSTSNPCRCSYFLSDSRANLVSSWDYPVANVPTGCTCKAGYGGVITASTASPFYTGSCTAVPCPANSVGINVPTGCTCGAGYSGTIVASTNSPYYTSSCTPVACPANSADVCTAVGADAGYDSPGYDLANAFVADIQECIFLCKTTTWCVGISYNLCDKTRSGNKCWLKTAFATTYTPNPCRCSYLLAASHATPISAANFPVATVPAGCICKAGSYGTITASTSSPFYTGSCVAVACPPQSNGANVITGCTCRPGYNGIIAPDWLTPFYTGSCGTSVGCSGPSEFWTDADQTVSTILRTNPNTAEYNNFQRCVWTVRAPSSQFVAIHILSLATELNYDFFRVYDGPSTFAKRIYSESGWRERGPSIVYGTSNVVTVEFVSDGSVSGAGVVAAYTASRTALCVPNPCDNWACLVNLGGHVMARAKVVPVYWGPNVAFMNEMNQFYEDILAPGVLDNNFAQYGVSYGRRLDPVVIGPTRINFNSDFINVSNMYQNKIVGVLMGMINDGRVPYPDDNTYYPIFFPSDISIEAKGDRSSCIGWCSYRGFFTFIDSYKEIRVFYSVHPNLDRNEPAEGGALFPWERVHCSCTRNGQSTFNSLTTEASRHLFSTLTDPLLGQSWVSRTDSHLTGVEMCRKAFPVDVAMQTTLTVNSRDYIIHKMWSNCKLDCV
jgi:hypothetical protein